MKPAADHGGIERFTTPADFNRSEEHGPRGDITTANFDTAGNMLTQTDALSHTTTYTYGSLSRLLTTSDRGDADRNDDYLYV